jgi:hypothetical protein
MSLRPLPRIPIPSRAVVARIGAKIRRSLGFISAFAPVQGMRHDDRTYARARLESVKIEEKYFFWQVIAQNEETGRRREPEGEIELKLPYDGDKYLTRQAFADIERGRALGPGRARVGYLTLTGYQDTDLDGLLDLARSYGSMPIDLPFGPTVANGAPDELVADRTLCRMSCTYKPTMKLRDIYPLDIELRLRDPDTAGFTHQAEPEDSDTVRSMIMQHVSFLPELLLQVIVRLHVPRDLAEQAKVEVSHVSVKWPTHTSLGPLAVTANGEPCPLRYNPRLESLEWFDVPMSAEDDAGGGDFVTFVSPLMELSIPQPGELYNTPSLEGKISVTVDRLLSGTDARLFDATGRQERRLQPKLKSVVDCDFTFILDDVFALRELTPQQQMHFDEVIPSEMRIHDIKNALVNLGYRVTNGPRCFNAGQSWWQLMASRTEGPERLWLDLLIKGRRYKARRRRRVPGGLTYQTNLESGDIRIYVYGTAVGDSQPVVHDVNALRRALDERFDRLPARR